MSAASRAEAYTAQSDLLWLHVAANAAIAFCFIAIPVMLLGVIVLRRTVQYPKAFVLFGSFFALSGVLFLIDTWAMGQPIYLFQTVLHVMLAIVAVMSLVTLLLLLPKALSLPSPSRLSEMNAKLTRANTELETLYNQFRESGDAHLKAVVDNVLDGLITIDERGTIITFNPACERIFGYGTAEVIGCNIKVLMPEPYHSEHDGYLEAYTRTGQARIIGTAGREVKGRRKDGSVFPMDLSVSSFILGGQRHFSGVVRDITRAKQAEEARQALLTRLTESNTELERFAYVASHDMQEPLRMVLSFSQILQESYADKLDEEGREYLHIMADSAVRMRDMVQDLLDYARLGREQPVYTQVDLSAEFNHVTENLHELIRESGASVVAGPLPTVQGHAVQLMRLMQNLIANAIKYQPDGNLPQVQVSARQSAEGWEVSIQDNGMGIPEAFEKQIFEPFRRLHTWDGVKGTGLGLAICRKIVENHGGRIWLVSEPGKGSTFTFLLPLTSRS